MVQCKVKRLQVQTSRVAPSSCRPWQAWPTQLPVRFLRRSKINAYGPFLRNPAPKLIVAFVFIHGPRGIPGSKLIGR